MHLVDPGADTEYICGLGDFEYYDVADFVIFDAMISIVYGFFKSIEWFRKYGGFRTHAARVEGC